MNDPIVSWLGNGISLGMILSTLIGWLPAIAALIGVIWYMVQIYESKTVQRWIDNRLRKKLLKLHAEAAKLELVLAEKNDTETREQIKHLAKVRTELDYNIGSLHQRQDDQAEAKAKAKAKEGEENGTSGNQV